MSDLKHLHTTDQSAESLWHMYKNAKNLLPYRYRMENLIWRMMFVKTGKRLSRDTSHAKLEFSSIIQTPFLDSVPDSVASAEKATEDFNYVAHIRKMSEAVTHNAPNRKRPAPMSPFMTHEADQDSFDGIVKPNIHSNLSAAFKGKYADHMGNEDHGYSFQLDSFTLEGPVQSEFSHSHQASPFPNQNFGGKSLPSTLPFIPTSALHSDQTFTPAARAYGSAINMNDSHPFNFMQHHASFSGFSSNAPQAISVPQNSHFPVSKRKTPSSSYDPSPFMYPSGPESVPSESLIKQENSLVSVSDHFASGSRPYTPYEFDDQTSVADSYFPGMFIKDTLSSNTPLRGSLAGPRMYEEPDSKLTFFDSNGQGNSANSFKQKQKLTLQTYPDDIKERTTNFWIEDHFNDSSSPHGSVSTSASGNNSGSNRVAPLPKKMSKKPKSKKTTKSGNSAANMEEQVPPVGTKSEVRPTLTKQKSTPQPSSKTPSINGNIECTNCYTKTTPLWRRNPQGEPLCNACGLFLKLHGTVRPLSLKTDVIKKRQRGQSSNQSTRKTSTAVAASASTTKVTVKSERDGDDFSPAPIGKSIATFTDKPQSGQIQQIQQSQQISTNPLSQTTQKPREEMDAIGTDSARNPGSDTDAFHSMNQLVKEEWNPVEQGDTAMFDGTMAESKSHWDWLSMNI